MTNPHVMDIEGAVHATSPLRNADFGATLRTIGSRISSMKRDRRPVAEQVRSGFVIVGKMLAAFGIAVVFLAGSTLIRTLPHTRNQVALGWLLVGLSVLARIIREDIASA
jgi:hypothetical protein